MCKVALRPQFLQIPYFLKSCMKMSMYLTYIATFTWAMTSISYAFQCKYGVFTLVRFQHRAIKKGYASSVIQAPNDNLANVSSQEKVTRT